MPGKNDVWLGLFLFLFIASVRMFLFVATPFDVFDKMTKASNRVTMTTNKVTLHIDNVTKASNRLTMNTNIVAKASNIVTKASNMIVILYAHLLNPKTGKIYTEKDQDTLYVFQCTLSEYFLKKQT